ncbi:guanine nucleotide-binding protein subunit gamma 3-like isoform X2 [Cicer arietinum]|uniref:Guanine nucleotide-binding protein subunit gamma 3-like isoform X1 n=1 Tax=Cicer arietinum TaxID=3827 RepID=A0A1S3EE37_CICAR|nr:guanine nucleotide-binding protein subunit gamma 3-like isoform X1 [Cicer arietinum]
MDGEYNFSSVSLTSKPLMEKLMSPKSPLPELVDFHGKRKQIVKIQVLEKEIGLLQEELKSLEGLHPASRCCKELDAFVDSISDPFTLNRGKHTLISESYYFGKQISFPWKCCSCSCLLDKKIGKGGCSSSKSKCSGSSCLKTRSTLSKIVAKF